MKYEIKTNNDGELGVYDMLDDKLVLTFSGITDERNVSLFYHAPDLYVLLNELIGRTDHYGDLERKALELINRINKGEY